MMRRSKLAVIGAGAFLATLLAANTSQALEAGLGHVAYGLGGATGPYSGFRQNLDLAVFPLLFGRLASGTYFGDVWLTAGASAMVGFGAYPSYASFEVGPAFSHYFGGIVTLGPAYRFGSGRFEPGGGGQLRVSTDFMLVEVGLRMIEIVAPQAETQLTLMAGVGRF
jgi:hypothetical protein